MNTLELPAFLDRRPLIWSFTMLKTYRDICAHQAAERYVYKHIPFTGTAATKRGDDVHKAFERRLGRQCQPLPADMPWEHFASSFDNRKVHPEIKLGITRDGKATGFFDNNVYGRGKIDAPIVEGETAYMVDWKSGKPREDAFELEIGAVLLKAKFPQLRKIVGRYAWLAENRLGPPYDLTDTARTWDEINRLVALILSDRERGWFDKVEGPLCKWCPVLDCEYNRSQQ